MVRETAHLRNKLRSVFFGVVLKDVTVYLFYQLFIVKAVSKDKSYLIQSSILNFKSFCLCVIFSTNYANPVAKFLGRLLQFIQMTVSVRYPTADVWNELVCRFFLPSESNLFSPILHLEPILNQQITLLVNQKKTCPKCFYSFFAV